MGTPTTVNGNFEALLPNSGDPTSVRGKIREAELRLWGREAELRDQPQPASDAHLVGEQALRPQDVGILRSRQGRSPSELVNELPQAILRPPAC
jgi:hypothetical protein